MKQNAKQILALLIVLIIFLTSIELLKNEKIDGYESVFSMKNFQNTFKVPDEKRRVHILIVPGHDDDSYGAKFKNTKEVELTRQLGNKLFQYLSTDERVNLVLASDENGYNPIFENYFTNDKKNISNFIESSKKLFIEKLSLNNLSIVDKNFHNKATDEVVYKLYGINRWVDIQDFDIVIHVHFNDYPGRKKDKVGKYEGFSIYIPGEIFENYESSYALADSLFTELKKVEPVSNFSEEKKGIIEDYELIALGANESLKAASVLVEYGYIYENNIFNPEKRDVTIDNFAYLTYIGIKNIVDQNLSNEAQVQKNTRENTVITKIRDSFGNMYPFN